MTKVDGGDDLAAEINKPFYHRRRQGHLRRVERLHNFLDALEFDTEEQFVEIKSAKLECRHNQRDPPAISFANNPVGGEVDTVFRIAGTSSSSVTLSLMTTECSTKARVAAAVICPGSSTMSIIRSTT